MDTPVLNEELIEEVNDAPVKDLKNAYASVLEYITNTFYRTSENEAISVVVEKNSKSANYYDRSKIVLAEGLMDAFGALNLPRFLIYYHELGHHLYSIGAFRLLEAWKKIDAGPLKWEDKYEHLNNWIEDYYIEERLLIEHSYLTDVVNCIKKLPPDYDIQNIVYAFNFWYIHQTPTPALSYVDQVSFRAYILKLLNLRKSKSTRFGYGILTTLSVKQSIETQYALLLIEFYNWCVSRKIFTNPLPSLKNPNNHIEQTQGNGPADGKGDEGSTGGNSSDHSKTVGHSSIPKEVTHISTPTESLKEELVTEARLIKKELLDMSQRVQTETVTLDGLFSSKLKESAIIQPRVIVPNFFNPHRLVDQVLFKEKQHSYMNVAIYRDISGSTHGSRHTRMHQVCETLMKEIPVDVTYYLYASGDVSIVEVPYIPWENSNKVPKLYEQDPLYQQLDGGTNSDAIADVITQQLSEKWLNIIITDGDLGSLMARDNIYELLKNVFVVVVEGSVPASLASVSVQTKADIEKIIPALASINLNR